MHCELNHKYRILLSFFAAFFLRIVLNYLFASSIVSQSLDEYKNLEEMAWEISNDDSMDQYSWSDSVSLTFAMTIFFRQIEMTSYSAYEWREKKNKQNRNPPNISGKKLEYTMFVLFRYFHSVSDVLQ